VASRPFADAEWAGRYEELRRQVLENGAPGERWGLSLLMHRGVTAWMRACAAAPVESRDARPAATLPSLVLVPETAREPVSLSPGLSGQAARILAQMILETRKEVLA
jgi:hypothetical protein